MLKNKLIIIPIQIPWEWSADYQNQTASILKRNNTIIVYNQGQEITFNQLLKLKKISRLIDHKNRIYFYQAIKLIPFKRFQLVKKINDILNYLILKIFFYQNFKKQQKILWCFHPQNVKLATLFKKVDIKIFDMVDFYPPSITSTNEQTNPLLKKIIEKCDLVFVNSLVLKRKFAKLKKNYLVPQGFSLPAFQYQIKQKNQQRQQLKTKKTIIIGFIGGISYRLDFKLLFELINKNPDWQFHFIGHIYQHSEDYFFQTLENINKLKKYQNVFFQKAKKRHHLLQIINRFDIAMIPYNSNLAINRFCYPMKLFEYFYLGKPVISTPIEELKKFPQYVKIGRNANEWTNIIKKTIKTNWSKEKKKAQKKLAINNSWEKKLEQMSQIINQMI